MSFGTACEDLNDEVLILDDSDGDPHCIIAAVPYLRDRDVRSSSAGESADSKDTNVIKGIRAHYDEVASLAKAAQQSLCKDISATFLSSQPVICSQPGKTTEDDGVRDLYVGNLGQISAEMFDEASIMSRLDISLLQRVGGQEHIRYSGSPIAMGFGEARQQKKCYSCSLAQGWINLL